MNKNYLVMYVPNTVDVKVVYKMCVSVDVEFSKLLKCMDLFLFSVYNISLDV